ncbi:hypothetical protein [Glaciecola petra]|uniref:Uncharacterized protein n=1 Tax=Glaciecola petra TaxID=3075602 RepID=A0ABU2ZRG5_9ALTE|nr:hypothetical protein [Aestuariibacter sp. P117]MDT0594909.1 hypothetical protein [Aestuariibacter sp. P117]
MINARKKASFRKEVAYFFFFLLVINIALKLLGISSLEISDGTLAAQELAIKAKYFALPLVFLFCGMLFQYLSHAKSKEAESYELGGTNW